MSSGGSRKALRREWSPYAEYGRQGRLFPTFGRVDAVLVVLLLLGACFFLWRSETIAAYRWSWPELADFLVRRTPGGYEPGLLIRGLIVTLRLGVWSMALALLIGGVFLLVLGLISWHTPVAYLGGLAVLELFYTLATGGEMTDVLYALLSGGVILGAFFMATDYVTSSFTSKGKLFYGVFIGLVTFLIRNFASMNEGMSFAILLGNLMTPWFNAWGHQTPLGYKKPQKAAKGGKE